MSLRDSSSQRPYSVAHQQSYSRHYVENRLSSASKVGYPYPAGALTGETHQSLSHDTAVPDRWRSLAAGFCGFAALAGLIWASAVSQSTFQADAQDATEPIAEETATVAKTPWQSASFPVENFIAYTSPFGYRNHPYGGRRFHYGLDIAAPMGSYIRAWWEGTVVEVSDDTACGTGIVVESHGWLHIYCHLQGYVVIEKDGDRWLVDHNGGIQVRQGDLVTSGQRIGRVGMTGRTTGPHLHWGMKYQGSWVDPTVVLKAMMES